LRYNHEFGNDAFLLSDNNNLYFVFDCNADSFNLREVRECFKKSIHLPAITMGFSTWDKIKLVTEVQQSSEKFE
jgi:hypothetical protein